MRQVSFYVRGIRPSPYLWWVPVDYVGNGSVKLPRNLTVLCRDLLEQDSGLKDTIALADELRAALVHWLDGTLRPEQILLDEAEERELRRQLRRFNR